MSNSPKRLGKYELQMRLGQGGMAEVWKGFDPQLKRSVAIKFLHANLRSDPDFVNRFVREGQAIAALRHPNIVQVYDFQVSSPEDENPMAYMVMDYIEGLTLADYLHRTSYAGTIPSADEIVHLFTSLGLAVDYAHQHGMIHRDIKPANILLDTRNTVHNTMGEPILTDFGIVKMLGAATITSTGISMGTPLYISPEQIHGQAGNDKSDIYALGVILYEMCTGEPPYRGDNPYVILAQRVTGPPEPPSQRNPDITPKMDEVILCCLAMDPQERFQSASELTAALADACDVPVPDLVRRTLSSSQLTRQATSTLSSHATPPKIETLSPISPAKAPVSRNNPAPFMGGETVLSETGGLLVSALERPIADALSLTHNETIISETGPTFVAAPESSAHIEKSPSDVGALQVAQSAVVLPSTPATQRSPTADLPDVAAQVTTTSLLPVRQHWPWLGRILLIVVLIGTGIGTYAFINNHNIGVSSSNSSIIVGNATFLSSGPLDGPFVNDTVQVHLNGVPDPAAGQRYYAWAQDRTHTAPYIFLGALQDHQGNATLTYTDSQHRNLLAYVSNLLVTEQATSPIPNQPGSDKQQWKYAATLSQTLSTLDHVSYLDHLRHLLVAEPTLESLQLHNGIVFWLLNSSRELSANALVARDSSNPQEVRQLLVNLIDYLDGPCATQELQSTPGSKIAENALITHASSISLLDCAQGTNPQGYITRMQNELNGMLKTPGISAEQVQRLTQMHNNLGTIRSQLEQIHTEVLQLVRLDDEHLQHAQELRNTLANQASDVIDGQFDPSTQTFQPSMQQIYNEVLFLARFDVSHYQTA